MSFSLFREILNRWGYGISEEHRYWIVLGGGEPTVHPDFWKMLTYSMTFGHPWLATNGSITEDALSLARLASKGIISAVLSVDQWHEKIDEKVINAFKDGLEKKTGIWEQWDSLNEFDKRTIRTITVPHRVGSSKEGKDECVCSVRIITPNGIIKGCACPDSPIVGTVQDGFKDEYNEIPWFNSCHKDWDFNKERNKWFIGKKRETECLS